MDYVLEPCIGEMKSIKTILNEMNIQENICIITITKDSTFFLARYSIKVQYPDKRVTKFGDLSRQKVLRKINEIKSTQSIVIDTRNLPLMDSIQLFPDDPGHY